MYELWKAVHWYDNEGTAQTLQWAQRLHQKQETSVAEHFNLPGHSMEDLTIMIIDQEDDAKKLREREGY